LIVSAAILPLAVVCAFALQALLAGQSAQTQASALGVARAVATAVDAEIGRTVATLQVLALSQPFGALGEADPEEARALAGPVLASHPEWRGLLLAAPSGSIVFATENAAAQGGEVVDKRSLDDLLRRPVPTVGPLTRGPRGNLAFPVRVPVIREGKVHYVLTAVVRPEAIAAVLKRQSAPDGWTVSVFDSNRARVARNLGDEQLRGGPPSESLRKLMETMGERREFVGSTTTIEGVRVQAALARVESAAWTVTLGASIMTAESARRRTLWAYGGGLLGSLLLGVLAAWWMSRAITRPMERLRDEAGALGQGEKIVDGVASGIREIDAVGEALSAAAERRSRSEAERERLLAAERVARANALTAGQRLERLVSASAMLSRSLEEASTLSAIAQVVVPDVADLCRIDLLDEQGVLQRKLTHHFDPERSEQIAHMVSERVAPSDAPGSFPWAIATGQMFLHNLSDPDLPEITDPSLREFVVALGLSAACVVPLRARGRTIGAMAVLQAESRRQFTPDDGVLIGELAQRAALALDNVRLLSEARAAQDQAEAANRTKDEFLAMLGHELRNPLAPISLALQLIARRGDTAFPGERQIIERQVKHLSRMVDDLLDVSRIVSGKVTLALESVDLRDVVQRAVEQTTPAMQHRTAPLDTVLPDAPVFVHGDLLRLTQIVCNLLTNAAKFTAPDRHIGLVLAMRGAQAQLTVRDEGAGIAAALLPHVFERFVQGSQALQRASGGLGLGLAIAQSLARLHGGAIEASSDGEGQGSTFVLRLPLLAAIHAGLQTPGEADRSQQPMRLLLVDDNLDALKMLAEWCTLEGHTVRTAASAEEALSILEKQQCDAGIFDIGLPGMNGYDLARQVRADDRARPMALVALTGYGQETAREHAFAAGFDDHFTKPADIEAVLARLEELVRQARR